MMPRTGERRELNKLRKKLEGPETKYCKGCKTVKLLYEFAILKNGYKMSQPYCLDCDSIRSKERRLKREHDITMTEYVRMLGAQDSKCKICGTDTPKGQGCFHVDHDHGTEKIRGLLCMHCNALLGYAKDDIVILAKAIKYLAESRK